MKNSHFRIISIYNYTTKYLFKKYILMKNFDNTHAQLITRADLHEKTTLNSLTVIYGDV